MGNLQEVEVWVPHRISGFFQMMNPKEKVNQTDLTKTTSYPNRYKINANSIQK